MGNTNDITIWKVLVAVILPATGAAFWILWGRINKVIDYMSAEVKAVNKDLQDHKKDHVQMRDIDALNHQFDNVNKKLDTIIQKVAYTDGANHRNKD